jgi:hypothetical protein
VASWPATGNVTTRPLPVQDTIQTIVDDQTQETLVVWRPNPDSFQDGYKVRNIEAAYSLCIVVKQCTTHPYNMHFLGKYILILPNIRIKKIGFITIFHNNSIASYLV